jgi:hypothetical protein
MPAILLCTVLAGLSAILTRAAARNKVNRLLDPADRFSWSNRRPSTVWSLARQYKRFYPDGKLLLVWRLLVALTFGCGAVFAWSLKGR